MRCHAMPKPPEEEGKGCASRKVSAFALGAHTNATLLCSPSNSSSHPGARAGSALDNSCSLSFRFEAFWREGAHGSVSVESL